MNKRFEKWWAAKNFEVATTTPILIQALKDLAWEAFQAGALPVEEDESSAEEHH